MNPRSKKILVYALVGGAVCVLVVSIVALPALSAAGFGILGPLAGERRHLPSQPHIRSLTPQARPLPHGRQPSAASPLAPLSPLCRVSQ